MTGVYGKLIGLALGGLVAVLPAHAQMAVHHGPDADASEISETAHIRFFQEVHAEPFPGAYHTLARLTYNGDYILLVETDAARRPISDTLLTWIQHHEADRPLAKQADWADLIISCYPDLLTGAARSRHVLPEAEGKIWLYFVDERHLIVSDQRHPALDFALKEKR